MKTKILPFILAISALSISVSAAFYSVTGLSKLFVGASTEVLIMASALEASKLVAASFLYQYWGKLNKFLKYYLTSAVFILVLITSMGIYGFLSSAYQESNIALQNINTQTEYYQEKINIFSDELSSYNKEYDLIQNNISNLSSIRASSIQIKDTSSSTGFRQTISTAELKVAQSRIKIEEENLNNLRKVREPLRDSIQLYKNKILNLKQDNSLTSELGPLIYLSELTGKDMDSIINLLLLTIIFVFDPLAISLVIAANFAFAQNPKKSIESPKPIQKILPRKKNKVKLKDLKSQPTKPIQPLPPEDNNITNFNVSKLNRQDILQLLSTPNLSAWKKNKLKRQLDALDIEENENIEITY
jgi:hypothetical protein